MSTETDKDKAYTPPWLVKNICDYIGDGMRRKSVLDPGAGTGAFLKGVRDYAPGVVGAIDIDPVAAASCGALCGDFLAPLPLNWPPFDIIMGNLPFSTSAEHLERALSVARERVTVIMQAGRLQRTGRKWLKLWETAWPDRVLELGRVTFASPDRDHGTGSAMADVSVYDFVKRGGSWVGRGEVRVMRTDGSIWPPLPQRDLTGLEALGHRASHV